MTEKIFIVFLLMIIAALLVIKKHLNMKTEDFSKTEQESPFCECNCKEMYLTEMGSLAEWVCDCCGKPKKTEDI